MSFLCDKHDVWFKEDETCWACTNEQGHAAHADFIENAVLFGIPANTETILQEAQRLVYSDRNADYGHPHDDYTRVGVIWGAVLQEWAKDCVAAQERGLQAVVPPALAALMMRAVKISREVNKPKRDNRVDLAGYAACVDRIRRREEGEE